MRACPNPRAACRVSKHSYSGVTKKPSIRSANVIDLRSDTVTQPGVAMREAMANAVVGDDVYGEDPTVIALEQRVAELLGKSAGLFVSSGTQSNLIAMLTHCQRGEEYIVGSDYHTFSHEAGGAAALGGVVPWSLAMDENNGLSLQDVEAAIKPDDPHCAVSRLLCLENTVSGKVQATEHIAALADLAHQRGLSVHLDGARLMNAAVALARPAAELAAPADTVSLCLSKGLGAPIGSVLVGPGSFISSARRLRKMLGVGTRQAGVLAACGQYALDHNVERLADDHQNAQRLAEGLSQVQQIETRYATNIVFVRLPAEHTASLAAELAEHNIIIPEQGAQIRLVTHLDINAEAVERVVELTRAYFADRA